MTNQLIDRCLVMFGTFRSLQRGLQNDEIFCLTGFCIFVTVCMLDFFFFFFVRFCLKRSWRKITWNINLEEKSKSSHISGIVPSRVKLEGWKATQMCGF